MSSPPMTMKKGTWGEPGRWALLSQRHGSFFPPSVNVFRCQAPYIPAWAQLPTAFTFEEDLKTPWSTHKAKSSLKVVREEIKRTQVLW